MRLPVAAKIALHSAAPTGGTPGSPFRTARRLTFMGGPVAYEVPLTGRSAGVMNSPALSLLAKTSKSPLSGRAIRGS